MLKVNKGILTLDIVNRYYIEEVPFYCNLDVFVFKLNQGKLQKDKDLVFYNNLSDAAGTVKFLAVGDADYDCDHRIYFDIAKLSSECDVVKLLCTPNFIEEKGNSSQGYFHIKATLKELTGLHGKTESHEMASLNFTVSGSPVLLMELKRNECEGFVLDFPNVELSQSIQEFLDHCLI